MRSSKGPPCRAQISVCATIRCRSAPGAPRLAGQHDCLHHDRTTPSGPESSPSGDDFRTTSMTYAAIPRSACNASDPKRSKKADLPGAHDGCVAVGNIEFPIDVGHMGLDG